MALVRTGNQAVLLVVDMQQGVVEHAWHKAEVISNIARAIKRAREQDVPVIWVQHDDEELVHGSNEWQIVPELQPLAHETIIPKHFNSSFEQTTLEAQLAKQGASHIALAGAVSNWCIRATAYAALERGYDLTLIKDAHTAKTMELNDGQRVEAQSIINDLNIAMTWLSYPGRRCSTATSDELGFN